jgi:hypothetical protein
VIGRGNTSIGSRAALRLAGLYLDIKDYLIHTGFSAEIDWQHDRSIQRLTETQFLRESAWVVLSSGFRESVLRPKFEALSKAFEWWSSASRIAAVRKSCRRRALSVFGNVRKIDAILTIADRVGVIGFQDVRMRLQREGVDFIQTLPFMGPITSFHLAKNVGIQVSKPDRHLVRISKVLGFRSVASLCDLIGNVVGDPVSVVDLVLWRYATVQPDYRTKLRHALRHSA